MSAAETTQEPTMEEILASIRRIISEEDQVPAVPLPPLDDVMDLPAPMAPPPMVEPDPFIATAEIDDLDMIDILEPEPVAAPMPQPVRPAPVSFNTADLDEGLIGEPAMNEALGAFGRLAAHMPLSDNPNQTLEGVVQDILRPMLKQWLDANLPRIVEEKVEAEIVRMSRVVRRAK